MPVKTIHNTRKVLRTSHILHSQQPSTGTHQRHHSRVATQEAGSSTKQIVLVSLILSMSSLPARRKLLEPISKRNPCSDQSWSISFIIIMILHRQSFRICRSGISLLIQTILFELDSSHRISVYKKLHTLVANNILKEHNRRWSLQH